MKLHELISALQNLQQIGDLDCTEVQLDALGYDHGVTQTPVDKVYMRGGKIIIEGEELAP